MRKIIVILGLCLAAAAAAAPVATYEGLPIDDGSEKWGRIVHPEVTDEVAKETRDHMAYESARNQVVFIFNEKLAAADKTTTVTRKEFELAYADQIKAVLEKEPALAAAADSTAVLHQRFLPGARLRKITDNWTLKQLRAREPAAYAGLVKRMEAQNLSGEIPLDRTLKFSTALMVLNRKYILEEALPALKFSSETFSENFKRRAQKEISAPLPAF